MALSLASVYALAGSSFALATSYSWANSATGGTWQNAANWTPGTGYPSSSADTGNIADSTANRTVTYSSTTSTGVGSIVMTQANNFLNELDVQQAGTVSLTISNSFTLSAAGTGTSDLFLDPILAAKSSVATVVAPSIAINAGGVLEMSSFDNTGTTALSTLTANLTITGGTFYSDNAVGVSASANSDANTINGSITMTSGTLSVGQHLAGPGSNAAKFGGTVDSTVDRLNMNGNVNITGGTFGVGAATDTLFFEGATNFIQLTGNGSLVGAIQVSNLATGTQTFQTDSAISGDFLTRQLLATVPTSYLQLGSASGGTLSMAQLSYRDGGASQTQVVQLVSNINSSVVPNYTADSTSDIHVIDTNGFTFDNTGANATFSPNYGTTGGWQLTDSKGSAAVGTVKALAYNISGPTGGFTIGSYVNLVATGVGSTNTLSNTFNSSTIDPTSTFTFAPTATGVGSLVSSRTIGNLVVSAQTLNLGGNITTGSTSTTTVAAAGSLNLNGYTLATSALTVNGTLTGGGSINASSGTSATGTLAPGGVGTVGSFVLTSGSGALTVGSTNTSKFDVATASSYDVINLSSVSVAYGGTLAVTFGYTPAAGDTYRLFSNIGTESGNFSTITSNESQDTLSFNPGTGYLTVSAVPEPMSIGLLSVAPLMLMRRRRSAARTASGV